MLKERPFIVDDEDPTSSEIVHDHRKRIDYSDILLEYGGTEPSFRSIVKLKNMGPDELFKTITKHGVYTSNGKFTENYRQPTDCLHIKCPQCNGTGLKSDRTSCIHMISCRCNTCSPITM